MLNGLKNFAINRILKHVAENPRWNHATNLLGVIPAVIYAALDAQANWSLMFQCCSKQGSLAEVLKIGGIVVLAACLYACGQFPWLKQWLPIAQEIVAEAQKEIAAKEGGK